MDIRTVLTTLVQDGFILVFNQDKLDIVKTAEALVAAGIGNMEVTCRISRPLEKLARLRKELPAFVAGSASLIDWPGMLKVYNRAHVDDPLPTLQQVVDAGACYLVSAVNFSDAGYHKFAGRLAMIPGCGSATEVVTQFGKGANLCKVFPAKELGGPAFIQAIDPAIHKTISLVPTGGTTAANIPDYVNAGVLVVGGSFSMIEKTTMLRIVDEQDYELLARELAAAKKLIDAARAKKYPGLDLARASLEEISQQTGRDFNIG